MKRRRKKVRKPFFTKKKILIFVISFIVIAVGSVAILGLGGLFSDYDDVEELVEVEKGTGKANFLLVGVDKEANLTDTIMVACYDFDNDEINIVSVPRDTRMYIGSRYQKINSAYAISKNGKKNGINGTIEAVTRLTQIPINYYVEFSLTAFRDTIDALGGVYYDVPQNMNYDDPVQDLHIHLKKGYQLLDGDKAEQLVRFRSYPMGDIDRVKVQQGFLKALSEQKLNLGIIEKVPELYKTVGANIKTNLDTKDVIKYAANLKDLTADKINLYGLPGTPNSEDYGASYWIADIPAVKEMVETVFGYDAENATIHSADGSSAAKDTKITTQTPLPTESPKPSSNASGTNKPTATKKPTKTPAASKAPQKPTEAPKATKTPQATKEPENAKTEGTTSSGGVKRPPAN